jgi:hypothetical protein
VSADLIYAYGLVRAGFAAARFPTGIDDAPVELHGTRGGAADVGALVSRVSGERYAPAQIEERSADVSWLSERAMAHDRVLTWAQELAGVVPFPIFTLFGSTGALDAALRERREQLAALFQRVEGADEYGVRIHRRDEQMLASIDQLDAGIAELRSQAANASPGQRYLLERKVAEQSKAAIRGASQRIAQETFDRLRALSRDSLSRPLTPDPDRAGDATLVLNGAFLVEKRRVDDFRRAVAATIAGLEPLGLSVDFTGPWPPYNFVGDMTARHGA